MPLIIDHHPSVFIQLRNVGLASFGVVERVISIQQPPDSSTATNKLLVLLTIKYIHSYAKYHLLTSLTSNYITRFCVRLLHHDHVLQSFSFQQQQLQLPRLRSKFEDFSEAYYRIDYNIVLPQECIKIFQGMAVNLMLILI